MITNTPTQSNSLAFLAKGGEMGERIRSFDWSQTLLGPIDAWPQSLKTAVGIMLGANTPIGIYWGTDLVLIYNDSWRDLIGQKHPQSLGRPAREVFPEIWEIIEPLFAKVMSGGGSAEVRNQRLLLDRTGSTDEAWFDFNFDPLPREDGSVGGIFNVAMETTAQVRGSAAMAEQDKQYRALAELGPEAIFVNVQGRFVYANAAAARLLGAKDPQDLLDRSPFDVIDPEHHDLVRDRIQKVLEGHTVPEVEYRWRRLDGSYLDVDVFAGPITWGGRKAIQVVVRNITDRKRREEALQESESRFRAMVMASSEVLYRMSPDWSEMRQLHSRGCLKETMKPSRTWFQEYIHPDDLALVSAAIGEAIRTKSVFELEHRVRRADGSVGWMSSRAVPLLDANGEIVEWFGAASDISARKEAEEALRKSEERYQLVNQATNDILWDWDLITDHLSWNQALEAAVGISREEMAETIQSWYAHIHPEDRDQVVASIHGAIDGGANAWSGEYRFGPIGGPYKNYFDRGLIARDNEGTPYRLVGSMLDLTERKEAEESLRAAKAAAEEASRSKSEFLANMSHEIRTPMTVFMAAIEHLLQLDRNPDRRQLLEMADQSAQRLRALIDDILDFSRIEARKVEIEKEPFDLGACVRAAVRMFALPARDKNLRLELVIAPATPESVIGDADRLGQVLINLIGNAVKFTHEGEVTVHVQPHGDLLEFSVSDTGIGIPMEKRDLLFESFSQADSSFTRQYGGTGLGLAISKGLVELMGGEISVRSRKRTGSVFTFTLPLQTVEKRIAAPTESKPNAAEEQPSTVHILLAEDEPMIREMITTMLAQHGWQVGIAESGSEAVEKWEKGSFDLILMDLQMPAMNGIEATRAIREREGKNDKRICIIGLTAHARTEIRDDCLNAGMDRVLTKPVQMKDLYSAIDICLSK